MNNIEAVQRYREKNRAVINARAKEAQRRRRADPIIGARIRQQRNANAKMHYARLRTAQPYRMLVLSAKGRARKKQVPYDLTVQWAQERWTGRCELTGIPFELAYGRGKKGGRPLSPSLDRIDPAKGYTQGNCRFVLQAINAFKGTMPDEEMLRLAEALLRRK